ncbi:MAG: cyclase family protein [Oscillospiraceae bacterium]|nr:cyclase family protein [Oscillospiraceae bacterium]
MRIIDISHEMFSSPVYPGDIKPEYKRDMLISEGSEFNLTRIKMCVHNSTHMDAPFHYIDDGYTAESIPLDYCVGYCSVAELSGIIELKDIQRLIKTCEKRLLIKGEAKFSDASAAAASEYFDLIGVESITVGNTFVHRTLLRCNTAVLEGIDLSQVKAGRYWLSAAPLKLGGCDGAPVRAYLIDK